MKKALLTVVATLVVIQQTQPVCYHNQLSGPVTISQNGIKLGSPFTKNKRVIQPGQRVCTGERSNATKIDLPSGYVGTHKSHHITPSWIGESNINMLIKSQQRGGKKSVFTQIYRGHEEPSKDHIKPIEITNVSDSQRVIARYQQMRWNKTKGKYEGLDRIYKPLSPLETLSVNLKSYGNVVIFPENNPQNENKIEQSGDYWARIDENGQLMLMKQ